MTAVGIDDIHVATGHHVLALADLAAARGVDPAKFAIGLGQHEMSIPAPDEDIVTMGAAAALPLLDGMRERGIDLARIRTVLFATESGIDQSKAAGVFVHGLLGLPSTCRVVELKQACYGGIAALQLAADQVARRPEDLVLVIASDVARYDVGSTAEPTQGAGAVAMLVSADPRLVTIDPVSGLHTADVDDFWRPNDRTTAIVDGRLSTTAYLDSLTGAWDDLAARAGRAIGEIDRFAYHQPFTAMARKAHRRLAEHTGTELADLDPAAIEYGRRMGNSYSASLPAAIAGLLDLGGDLDASVIAAFSYGSGSVGELVTGVVVPGARTRGTAVQDALDARVSLTVAEYEVLHAQHLSSSADATQPRVTTGPFRLVGVEGGARRYERTSGA